MHENKRHRRQFSLHDRVVEGGSWSSLPHLQYQYSVLWLHARPIRYVFFFLSFLIIHNSWPPPPYLLTLWIRSSLNIILNTTQKRGTFLFLISLRNLNSWLYFENSESKCRVILYTSFIDLCYDHYAILILCYKIPMQGN